MTRRILTARDQVALLAPWRMAAAPDPSINGAIKKFVKKLHGEMKQWAREAHEDDFAGDPSDPAYYWEDIESFLKNRYPAAHRGMEMGMEDARPLVHGAPSSFDAPYETGPEAEGKYGYDPHQVAAAMVLLHNKADGDRGWAIPEDMGLLVDIFTKRQQMQRDYERRQGAAWRTAATPEEARDEGGEGYQPDPFMDSWNEDISPPADLDGPWYHATYADLRPGDKLLPHSANPIDQGGLGPDSKFEWFNKPGMGNRRNFVWMYQHPLLAHEYFQKYKRKKRNGPRGRLYVVKPDDTPQRWNNSVDGEHVSHSATVVGEIRPEALEAAMKGWLWSPEHSYKWTKAKGDNPGQLIPEMFPDLPYKLPPGNRWRAKGYDELSVRGWGGTPQ